MKHLVMALAVAFSTSTCGIGSDTVIYLIRHAEPDDQYYGLTENGQADARRMGEILADHTIYRIYTSPTERTRQTSEIMASVLHLSRQDITLVDGLNQDEDRKRGWVAAIDGLALGNQGKNIAIVTHHPVITAYAKEKRQQITIDFGTIIRISRDADGTTRFQQIK